MTKNASQGSINQQIFPLIPERFLSELPEPSLLGGSDALMELANPEKKIKLQVGGWDVHCIDVKYVGSSGDIVMPQKCLSGEIARRLVNGDRVPITYLKSDPNQVLFSREELSIPWGWLLIGMAAMLAGFYSKKLLHRDA